MSNFKALQQVRRNELGIQMIPSYLRNILFGDLIYKNSSNQSPIDKSKLERVKAHLHKHNLWNKPNRHAPRKTARHPGQSNSRNTNEASSNEQDGPKFKIPDMEPTFFKMPSLCGANVEEHFDVIGRRYSKPYADLATAALNHELSVIPTSWKLAAGWHKYTVDDNGRTVLCEPVPYPNETFLVFDVEVCMNDSNGRLPTLAVAAGPKHWYLWCSDRLVSGSSVSSLRAQLPSNSDSEPAKLFTPNARSLIPFGIQTETARLIVGHNVSFDRSYISEQYNLKQDALRFLDTMSLHISISGLTGYQRALCFSYRSAVKHGATDSDIKNKFERAGHPDPSAWADSGSLNSLAEVYQFYCNQKLDKADRDLFVTGSLDDVRADFQTAASYCARDVRATWQVMARLWPQFQQRFPHSVTLAGMLEMSAMYLPINLSNWNRYLQQAQQTYDDLQSEQSASLVQIANDSCKMIRSDRYRKDVWFWDLDWSTQSLRYRKSSAKMEESLSEVILETKPGKKPKSNDAKLSHLLPLRESTLFTQEDPFDSNSDALLNKKSSFMKTFPFVHKLLTAGRNLKKVQPLLAGYPHWYREFCDHPFGASKQKKMSVMEEWLPGPFLISTQMRAVPKLLRLTWNGHILHYDSKEGWGFLVPTDQLLNQTPNQILLDDFPIKEYLRIYRQLQSRPDQPKVPTAQELLSLNELESEIQEFGSVNGNDIRLERRTPRSVRENGELVGIPMFGCYFYRLPHKDGPDNRVGNPLGKEFVRHMESGALRAFGNRNATQVLKISKTLSYWKMANKRIASQMICQCDTGDSAALLPRVIVAGTITRRAVEPTWLTASNAYEDRAGSELKAMIQAPPGYKFVGADVDSQELWIASLFGDSNFSKIHGGTALGWMTLQGSKNQGTDMHSTVANLVGISRNEAKVLNYGRIYGAGKSFAARFLRQSNPNLTEKEAKTKAETIYKQTKGNRRILFQKSNPLRSLSTTPNEAIFQVEKENNERVTIANDGELSGEKLRKSDEQRIWVGGSESHMFNELETIALSSQPKTPVLNCLISTSLLNDEIRRNFLTSIVNWVVQSSAVDYLHLMLVSMRHLMDHYEIDGRFSISIHDEVRYLIKDSDQHRAAFALQISNLLTRAMFASRVQMYDLPLSVAFFSSVDLDSVLRKEVNMDCKTPSNPHGLRKGYGIPFGESLDIYRLLKVSEIKELTQLTRNEKKAISDCV